MDFSHVNVAAWISSNAAWLAAALGLVLAVGFIRRAVWAVGLTMVVAAALFLSLLFALWPVRASDLAAGQSVTCGLPSPTPTPTQRPTPPPKNPPRVASGAVPAVTPSPSPEERAKRAAITAQLDDPWLRCATVFGGSFHLPFELRLFFIVALSAALGAFVHIATSFSDFLGNGAYSPRWLWWYALRVPVGVALAFMFYFAIRGGILTTTSLSTTDINPFGIAAIAGLVGLFSKQASDKLAETFSTIFKTDRGGDAARGGKIDSIVPTVDSVDPKKIRANADAVLEVTGSNFREMLDAQFPGKEKVTVWFAGNEQTDFDRADDRHLKIRITAEHVGAAGKKKLEVKNQTPAGSASVITEVTVE